MIDPRDIYQARMEQETYDAWNSGARAVVAVLPTGGGKSVYMTNIAHKENAQGIWQCTIAHRTELTSQMSMHYAARGIKHRIIAPKNVVADITAAHRKAFNGYSFINPDAIAAVAAIDTLMARREALKAWAEKIESVKIDEAHHVLLVNKWGRGVDMFPRARLLGVTASPTRADGQGLGRHADGVFDVMIQGPDMRSLINMGALCEYELVCPTSDLEVSDDDFNAEGELSPRRGRLASKKSHIVGDIVKRYIQYALGKRTIVFVTDVETANEVATNFNAHGIRAAAVNGETDPTIRREYIERFRDGRLDVLVNVDLFGEGFDVPACECVIMGRPTNSLAVYLQQFGRALRLMFGKLFGLIIDMVSNYKRHGFPDKPHYWTLDRQEKRARREKDPEEIELTVCRNCSRPYERFYCACPHCGAVPPVPVGGVRSLEQVDGDLTYLSADVLAQMRAAAAIPTPAAAAAGVPSFSPAHAATGAAYRAMERWSAQARLDAAISQWAGFQRHAGRSDRETHKRFFLTIGMSVLEARALPRADMEKIAERVEGWCQ